MACTRSQKLVIDLLLCVQIAIHTGSAVACISFHCIPFRVQRPECPQMGNAAHLSDTLYDSCLPFYFKNNSVTGYISVLPHFFCQLVRLPFVTGCSELPLRWDLDRLDRLVPPACTTRDAFWDSACEAARPTTAVGTVLVSSCGVSHSPGSSETMVAA